MAKAMKWIFSTRRSQAIAAWKHWTHNREGDIPSKEFAAGFALGVIYREAGLEAEGIDLVTYSPEHVDHPDHNHAAVRGSFQ